MSGRHRSERGSAAIEAALVILPMLFLLFAALEVSRAIWIYHTLSSAVKHGARFAAVHGSRCVEAASACQATVSQVTSLIRTRGIGMDFADLQLTFSAGTQSHTCAASSCLSSATNWPASPNNAVGQSLKVAGSYTFRPAIAVLWPGQAFRAVAFRSEAMETIQF